MSEPQIWTIIGVFAAGLVGILTLVSSLFLHVVRSETAGLMSSINGLRAETGTRIDGLRAELGTRMDGIDRRLDHLDRDVQTLVRHVFPDRP